LFLDSPPGSFIFEPLLSCFFIAAGGAERCAPNPAQLLGFREELDVDGNSDVSHVLEPANGLVYFLDDGPEFRDEFGRRAPPFCSTVVRRGGGRRPVKLIRGVPAF
jgi:hypothetical protein